MTPRRSRRELRRAVEELETDPVEEYDPDPLTPGEKQSLAEAFDTDPWDPPTPEP